MVYEENELIGKRLRKIRRNNRMECVDMASILGISEGHYRKIERGLYGLDVPKLAQLYHSLSIDPMYLLFGKVDFSREYTKKDGIVDRKRMLCDLLDFCKQQINDNMEV